MAMVNFCKRLREASTCCICLDYFTHPVTTDCGHNFCRACVTQSWKAQGRKSSCPLCREPAQKRDLKPNPRLASIAGLNKLFGLQGTKRAVCERHREPLKHFCMDDEAPVCVACKQSKGHRAHRAIPVEEAVEECKEKIQALVERKIQTLVEQEKAEEQRSQVDLKQLEEKKQEITSALEEVRRYLQEKEHCWLRQLAGLEEETKRRQEENTMRLSKEISDFTKLRNLITDVELRSQQPPCEFPQVRFSQQPPSEFPQVREDGKEISNFSNLIQDVEWQSQQPPSEFLQHLGNTLSRCPKRKMTENLEPSPGLKWRLKSNTLKISVLKKAVQDLEGSLTRALNEVSVTLDPDTAYPELVLFEDLKRVRRSHIEQNLPDNPERFDMMPCVLGRERFTSGRHHWVVEVEKLNRKELWGVGVALESLKRKGWVFLTLPKGIWAVVKDSSRPHRFAAHVLKPTRVEATRVDLKGDPQKIRVFLDYEEGRVEFFDGDTDDWIFTFPPASFCGKGVRPFFWVGSGVRLKC